MTTTLQQVLGGRNLTGLIQNVKPGLPADAVPQAFNSTGLRRRVTGNSGTYFAVDGTRQTAKLAHYGSASTKRQLKGVKERPVTLIHTFEHIEIKASDITNLDDPDGNKQVLGRQEVERQVQETRTILDNTRMASLMSALSLGAVYYDADGNLLASSSGAQVTVDFQRPSGNEGQLDWDGSGAIIDATWATNTTNIMRHLQEIHEAALKLSGYGLSHAIYGANILQYLLTNTHAKELINRTPANQTAASRSQIPAGFGDLTWWPGYKWFYEDEDGTIQPFVGADEIVFIPEPDPTWFEWLEGTYAVPSAPMFNGDASGFAGSLMEVQGRFAYGEVVMNPPGGRFHYGDTFLPVVKVPKAVFKADVTP